MSTEMELVGAKGKIYCDESLGEGYTYDECLERQNSDKYPACMICESGKRIASMVNGTVEPRRYGTYAMPKKQETTEEAEVVTKKPRRPYVSHRATEEVNRIKKIVDEVESGQISSVDALKKYNLNRSTLYYWCKRHGSGIDLRKVRGNSDSIFAKKQVREIQEEIGAVTAENNIESSIVKNETLSDDIINTIISAIDAKITELQRAKCVLLKEFGHEA